jgi:3-methylcrotonyl-CoA carboxylase alpha subunit
MNSHLVPLDGTVEQVRHAVDDMVEEGTELVTFEAEWRP